jgi:hypothetical protein
METTTVATVLTQKEQELEEVMMGEQGGQVYKNTNIKS